jgi:hypothetical protein
MRPRNAVSRARLTVCPAGPNLVKNPNFETVGPCGTFAWTSYGSANCGFTSAAADWKLHGDNYGHPLRSYFVAPSDLPLSGYSGMLRIIAAGNESGVYQLLPAGLTKVVASVWVKVIKGHVAFQTNGGTTGPVSWSTKINEWELLRVASMAQFR